MEFVLLIAAFAGVVLLVAVAVLVAWCVFDVLWDEYVAWQERRRTRIEAELDAKSEQLRQTILKEKINGERSIKHDHYLKSTIYCGHCGFRMVVQVVKNRHGETYPYYSGLGRHSKRTDCTLRSIQIEHAEDLIQDLYDRIGLAPEFRRDVETLLRHGLKQIRTDTDLEREQLEATKQTIERRQRKLLEAHYNDAIPIDMLRTEQKRLDAQLSATTRSLDALNADLTEADELIEIALDIAQHAGKTYRQAPEHIRRMFNQLLFDKLLVTTDDNGQHHVEATSRAPFDVIYSPDTRALVHETRHAQHDATPDSTGQTKKPAETGGLSLDVLSDQFIALVEGSSKSIMVDAGGLSPNTWERLERLSSAWEQAKRGGASKEPPAAEPDPGVVANPTRRSRTPLAPNEVDAIRTARANGESVLSICRRFDIHRVTVWEKTRTS
ncbi:recombinase zinc beta ribbon domain-containing protein [Dermabacter sp.]|uniref:recombinase zinc beta ribbon domain-containing protein n=1 Tax=Dermabacter sp. TaxID=37640 RepID=UPI0029141680|nr:recombinase zinc beta ribbon domain-containing protein [Dermabacter sp.]MDU4922670.1 recombinase zinc beta ribbon domain-containing protein [Dermabacter sp.]